MVKTWTGRSLRNSVKFNFCK